MSVYDFSLTKEENLAIEILKIARLNKFNADKLFFEITNSISKKVFFTYVLKPITDISLIEHHLQEYGIDAKFIDKNIGGKRYLTIRID